MAHATFDLVHSDQGGPRGDDKAFLAGPPQKPSPGADDTTSVPDTPGSSTQAAGPDGPDVVLLDLEDASEVAAWAHRRNERKARIHWTFTLAVARQKLAKLYPSIEA